MMNQNKQMMVKKIDITARQAPLKQRYREIPAEAIITDWARTIQEEDGDTVHGRINMGRSAGGAQIEMEYADNSDAEYDIELPTGIHRAIGGDHDLPNPGNFLSAALAVCMDSTIRMIANHLGVTLEKLSVEVASTADVRGTLVVDRDVPVEFQQMDMQVDIQPAPGTPTDRVRQLLAAAEYSSVNLQTLQKGVPVEIHYRMEG